jgi:chromosome segregation ATPase
MLRGLGAENLSVLWDEQGKFNYSSAAGFLADTLWDDSEKYSTAIDTLQELSREYNSLWSAANDATDTYNTQKAAYDEAKIALDEYRETVAEMPGDTEAAAAAADKLTQAQKAAAEASVGAVKTAISALADYVQAVHDATEQTVNSVVKGFDVIERPTTEMEEKRSKLIEQQNALNRSTAEGERQYQALQKQIDSLNESMSGYTAKGMEDALKSQLAFMDEYVKNLEQAQKMGLSDDLLASLSDGSVQSAEYLSQLVANPEQAKEIDALYQQVQQKKKGFTDALTNQKLAADDMYASLVDTAKDAIAQMDQGEDAKTAMENTVAGLASGISEKVPEVRSAVNDLLAELNRLSGFGVNITIPGFGSLLGPESSISFQGASAAPTGMNYDLLGDVVRANTGGNVYLDGRKVGSLISEQQGSSYRSMQRSGFQP